MHYLSLFHYFDDILLAQILTTLKFITAGIIRCWIRAGMIAYKAA
jgi:hypothetical protein